MKILILASNPRKDLNLDDEIRDLKDAIERSANRQQFEVEHAPAVRVGDLQDLLFKHLPQIVHFCGHGSGKQGLVFKGSDGGEQWVRAEALSEMFRLFSKKLNISCVLLNACYSEEQANAIVNHIDYVIGMSQDIRDDAAIAFSKGFYRALGNECSVEQAYDFGKNAIQLEISGSSKMRSAATDESRKADVVDAIQQIAIPEHLKPILKIKPTSASSLRANVTATEQPISQETRVDILSGIDQSLEEDAKVKQYRDRVQEFLADRKLTAVETSRLEWLRKDLGLSEAEANRILEEEQEPIRKARDEYKVMLTGLIEAGPYPLDAETGKELQSVQQELGLSDEEVKAIEAPILVAAEKEYQGRVKQEKQQEYQQQLHLYEQEFRKAIEAQYPLDSFVRDGLRQFQQSLKLSDADIAGIEGPIVAPKEAAYQQRLAEEQRIKTEAERKRELERLQELEQQERLKLEAAAKQRQTEEEERQQQEAEQLRQQQAAAEAIRLKQQEQLKREADEKPQEQVKQTLPDALKGNYAHLEALLKAGKWKEADKETAQQMCQVMGQREGWLEVEDIEHFPYADLRMIDQLWVKYSGGRFGFSVQKKIWLRCGSPSEYNKQWEKFGEEVGWRSKGLMGIGAEWNSYREATFNISAPKGHFPLVGVMGGVWFSFAVFFRLLSRSDV